MRTAVRWALLIGLTASAAQAQEQNGGYLGLSLGSARYRESDDEFGLSISDSATSYRILGGYQFADVYGIEVAWGATSDITESFLGVDSANNLAELEVAGEYEIATVRFLAFAPFEGLSMFGGAGYYDAKLDVTWTFDSVVDPLTLTSEQSESGATVVGGLQYDWDRIGVRGEYEWFDTDDADLTNFNVSLLFRF
ncbi:MAG TPA: outer membrane beta-barrel protein [Gammaproteobacteria bacterium]